MFFFVFLLLLHISCGVHSECISDVFMV